MSTLFLFGAGASTFSGECLPHPPPLGNQLFDELAKRGGIAAKVDEQLAARFRANFEDGMAAFRETHEVETTSLVLAMADYFADFEPGPNNLYIKLLRELSRLRRRCTFATLNYDLLIELGACAIGRDVRYSTNEGSAEQITVLKLHGSCNFLPATTPRQFFNIGFDLSAAPGASILEAPVRVAQSAHDVHEFCRRENSLAPALSLYTKGKTTLFCPDFVRRQQAEYAEAAANAARAYVIGVRINEDDDHVWQPLAKSPATLYYVGPDRSDFLSWAEAHRRHRSHHLSPSFDGAIASIVRHHRM